MKSIESYMVNESDDNYGYDNLIQSLENAITYCSYIHDGNEDDIRESIERLEKKIKKMKKTA